MVKVPNPHRKPPADSRKAVASGPPIHVVMMYGELMKANANARFLRAEVSAMKMPQQYETPL